MPRGQKEIFERRTSLLQSALEHMEEGVSVFDREGRLVAWNSQFFELLGLSNDLSEGAALADILRLQTARGDFGPGDLSEIVQHRLKEFYENVPMTRERITPAGRVLRIRRRGMPDGNVMTLYADITEQSEMAQACATADLANRSKSAFLAHMSHELRTPLNAIIGFSELICHGVLGPIADQRFLGYIRDIRSSGLHLLDIVNDVLDMSKIEAGKVELALDWVPVQQVIDGVIAIVGELASCRNLQLVTQGSPDEIMVWADERALKQIALNLLSNAIKFSSEGGRIDISTAGGERSGVTFEVRDYGIGMTTDELERALQPFGQAKSITSRTYGGTGL
jgi:PAS domain S-box-containing protein